MVAMEMFFTSVLCLGSFSHVSVFEDFSQLSGILRQCVCFCLLYCMVVKFSAE